MYINIYIYIYIYICILYIYKYAYIYIYIYIYIGRVKGMWSLHTTSHLMTGTTSGAASKVVAAAERLRGLEAALLQLAVAAEQLRGEAPQRESVTYAAARPGCL
jgi:hypothetical protein